MTNYQKGVYLERRAKELLENHEKKGKALRRKGKALRRKKDYLVIRSAGSHGIFDLVALNRKHIRLIQVKKDRITKQEIENLIKLSNLPENCVKEVWFRNERGWEVKTVKSNNSLSILENEA